MRPTPRSRSRSGRHRPLAAAWLAAALGLLLLGGTFELHVGEEAGHSGLGVQSEQYTLGAAHPELPPHVERGVQVRRPRCAVCLAHLQTSGIHLPLVATLPPLDGVSRPAPTVVPAASRGAALRPRGRAPPFS